MGSMTDRVDQLVAELVEAAPARAVLDFNAGDAPDDGDLVRERWSDVLQAGAWLSQAVTELNTAARAGRDHRHGTLVSSAE